MLGNKRLYLKEDGVDESFFVPRPDIVEFAKRREREKKLDRYILDNFRFSDDASKKKGETGARLPPRTDQQASSDSQPTADRDARAEPAADATEDVEARHATSVDPGPIRNEELDSDPEIIPDPDSDPDHAITSDSSSPTDLNYAVSTESPDRSDRDKKPDPEPRPAIRDEPDRKLDPESIELRPKTKTRHAAEISPGHEPAPDLVTSQADPQANPTADTSAKRSARSVNNRLLELHDRVLAGPPWRPLGAWLERTHVTSGPAELRGEHRFVADGMLTSRDCRRLIDILQAAGVAGDGYRQRVPHTPFEEFRGLSFGRLVVKVARDEASRNSLRFLMDVADAARLFVARQFGVVELHSSYTHLVGRTYLPGLGQKRPASDLSHPIHVDNCLLFDNGTCSRGKGAYIHRHYSAILYLNDNFKGGEFVFARDLIDRKPVVSVAARSNSFGRDC
ncbi:uncharacterized protein LOC119092946 [Pollicipes pollicipes]|uniref:uncharacterized protein LOC119092946 n=1 Tax=Pollicipes pollicipes TaxID=41117 RepID=UPI0018853A1F|nr:uncharacterized protein LOC119092946 [Pollicipes pollicipes]